MRLSTKTRYGTRAMIELAKAHSGKVSPVNVIAKNQNISERYLQNILLVLVDAGLVKSIRGKNGGFVLSKEASKITLAEIVVSLEEDKFLVECVEDKAICESSSVCVMKSIWEQASEALYDFLSDITLGELSQMAGEKESGEKILNFNI